MEWSTSKIKGIESARAIAMSSLRQQSLTVLRSVKKNKFLIACPDSLHYVAFKYIFRSKIRLKNAISILQKEILASCFAVSDHEPRSKF